MAKSARVLLIFTLVSALLCAQTPGGDATLPVKRVVLYKNGVGYFEHVGRVRGNQDVSVPFTSGQLNDVLKSLTVLDLNGGKISGVTYGSSAPVDRQLGELRLPAGEQASLTDFLRGLRGAKMEVRTGPGTSIVGRLLSVERKTRMSGGATLEVDYVALVTDAGEIRTTEVSPAFSVKLLEAGLPGKVGRLLDLAAGTREPDVRAMTVSTAGEGERSLFLSYISEVPVWKSTYRIVIDKKAGKSPLLQGWAIVDNTVGQDWDNVELSLVAGAPQSFVQNISQPFYTRRPVVAVAGAALVTPQTYESTLVAGRGQIAGVVRDPNGSVLANVSVSAWDSAGVRVAQGRTGPDGRFVLSGVGGGSLRVRAEMPGFKVSEAQVDSSGSGVVSADLRLAIGDVAETVTVSASAPALETSSADMANVASAKSLGSGAALGGRGGGIGSGRGVGYGAGYGSGTGGGAYRIAGGGPAPDAVAQELGDLFEYKLKQPITIRKNRSAMVPIVQAPVDAEKVSVFNEATARQSRPMRALWIANTSGVTLDGGSFSVLEEDTFAGEGVFEAIRPAEKRLVSYAIDLAVNVGTTTVPEAKPVYRVKIDKGVLTQFSELREKKTYTFRNEDSTERTMLVEHPVRAGFDLSDGEKPVETTVTYHRFRKAVGPKQTSLLVVEEVRPLTSTYQLTNLNPGIVVALAGGIRPNARLEAELQKILDQKDAVARLDAEKTALDGRVSAIYDDQQRLRENLKSLKSTPEEKALVQRYTAQLAAQETQLDSLKREVEEAGKKVEAAQAALDRMISELSLDEKI